MSENLQAFLSCHAHGEVRPLLRQLIGTDLAILLSIVGARIRQPRDVPLVYLYTVSQGMERALPFSSAQPTLEVPAPSPRPFLKEDRSKRPTRRPRQMPRTPADTTL